MSTKTYSVGDNIYAQAIRFEFDDKSEDGFFYLKYLGQDGQRFYIGYRECIGNQLRDRFSENLVFEAPGNSPTKISYKNVLITVVQVNNSTIEIEE